MSLTFTAAAAPSPKLRQRQWTPERIARLRALADLGWRPERIARDPLIIPASAESVGRQARRLHISFRKIPVAKTSKAAAVAVPSKAYTHFGVAAAKRGLSREALAHRLLMEIASDPNLIANILDDGA